METVIKYTRNKKFDDLNDLFNKGTDLSLFFQKNKNNISAFDISLKYIRFSFNLKLKEKKKLLKLMKKHFYNYNLLLMCLYSNTIITINKNNKLFYYSIKNIFEFLHKVNKNMQIDGSFLITSLENAFKRNKKDSVNLMKYLFKLNIVKSIKTDKYLFVYFDQSVKMIKFVLNYVII